MTFAPLIAIKVPFIFILKQKFLSQLEFRKILKEILNFKNGLDGQTFGVLPFFD